MANIFQMVNSGFIFPGLIFAPLLKIFKLFAWFKFFAASLERLPYKIQRDPQNFSIQTYLIKNFIFPFFISPNQMPKSKRLKVF